MYDLISRKDAVSRISDLLIIELKGARIPTWNEVYNAIGDIQSVPAVPLDKLCEWLAGNAWHLDCSDCDGEHCDCPQLYDDSGSSPEFWKAKLLKWMDEQNDE